MDFSVDSAMISSLLLEFKANLIHPDDYLDLFAKFSKFVTAEDDNDNRLLIDVLITVFKDLLPFVGTSQAQGLLLGDGVPVLMKFTKLLIEEIEAGVLSEIIFDNLQYLCAVVKICRFCLNYLENNVKEIQPVTRCKLLITVMEVSISVFKHCRVKNLSYNQFCDKYSEVELELQKILPDLLRSIAEIAFYQPLSSHDTIINILNNAMELNNFISLNNVQLKTMFWRNLFKFTKQWISFLKLEIDILPHLLSLIRDIGGCIPKNRSDDEKLLETHSKGTHILMQILIHYFKSFENSLNQCGSEILKLMVIVYQCALPSSPFCTSNGNLSNIRRQLLSSCELILSQVSGSIEFSKNLIERIDRILKREDTSQVETSTLCILLLTVIDTSDTWSHDIWIIYFNSECNLLSRFFQLFQRCHSTLLGGKYYCGTNIDGKSVTFISFYEYCLTHVCSFLSTIPVKFFRDVFVALLKEIISSTFWSILLAIDISCFLGRLSTLYSLEFCKVLTIIVEQRKPAPGITFLMSRLLAFLTENNLSQFYKTFSSPSLWSYVSISSLPKFPLRSSIIMKVSEHMLTSVHLLSNKIESSGHEPKSETLMDLAHGLYNLTHPLTWEFQEFLSSNRTFPLDLSCILSCLLETIILHRKHPQLNIITTKLLLSLAKVVDNSILDSVSMLLVKMIANFKSFSPMIKEAIIVFNILIVPMTYRHHSPTVTLEHVLKIFEIALCDEDQSVKYFAKIQLKVLVSSEAIIPIVKHHPDTFSVESEQLDDIDMIVKQQSSCFSFQCESTDENVTEKVVKIKELVDQLENNEISGTNYATMMMIRKQISTMLNL